MQLGVLTLAAPMSVSGYRRTHGLCVLVACVGAVLKLAAIRAGIAASVGVTVGLSVAAILLLRVALQALRALGPLTAGDLAIVPDANPAVA
jgi:hypothetical protein